MMDEKIIKRFKEGNAEAFSVIYHHYSKKTYFFVFGMLKEQDQAKEIVQQSFC